MEKRYYLNLYGSLILFGAGKACCNETLRKGTNTILALERAMEREILALNRFLIYVTRPKAMVDESRIYIYAYIYMHIIGLFPLTGLIIALLHYPSRKPWQTGCFSVQLCLCNYALSRVNPPKIPKQRRQD